MILLLAEASACYVVHPLAGKTVQRLMVSQLNTGVYLSFLHVVVVSEYVRIVESLFVGKPK